MKVAASPRIYMGRCPKAVFKSPVTSHQSQVTSYKKKPCHQKDGMAFRMLYFVDHLFFQRKSLAVEMAREREGEKPYSKKERRVSFQLVIAAINI